MQNTYCIAKYMPTGVLTFEMNSHDMQSFYAEDMNVKLIVIVPESPLELFCYILYWCYLSGV